MAASNTFTIFTLGFSAFGTAHCAESKREHERELRIEEERLYDLTRKKEEKEIQLQKLKW